MCDLHSHGSAGSGCHPDKFTGYLDQNPLPAIPASVRVRPFSANDLNFTGPDVAALGPGIAIKSGGSNFRRTVDMSTSTPAGPFAANTGGHQATKTRKITITKLANGKRRIPLSTKNVYSSTAASGRGKAKVGGGGVPAGTCIVM
jgi:hypothetical protein